MTIKEIAEQARKVTLAQGCHVPTIIVESSLNGAVCQLDALPADQNDKLRRFLMAGVSLSRHKAIGELKAVFLITEGWMSIAQDGKLPELPPSRDPKRREVLLITGTKPLAHDYEFFIWEIVRDSVGRTSDLTALSPSGLDGASMLSPLLRAFLEGYRIGLTQQAS